MSRAGKYWDLYENCQALDPEVGFIPFDEQDPHSQRLYRGQRLRELSTSRASMVRRSRRGYFANISYIDDKVGELVSVLERTRMLDDTVILFCSDHGDMLGERGLWFKMCFFEGSARVPLMIAGNGIAPGLIEAPVSNLDVLPTLCDLAGIDMSGIAPWTDGQSLLPLTRGEARDRAGADGICGRRQLCAAGGDPRRPLQVHPLRDRPAATL